MIKIDAAISKLDRVFHSEDDFQHELAWVLREQLGSHSEWEVRLEYPAEESVYIDICLVNGESVIPIELKYRTTTEQFERDNEIFRLKEHSARDTGRYEFIHDIERIERLVEGSNQPGFAVFLTNDAGYWRPGGDDRTANGDAFRIHENRILEGTLDWREYKDYMPDKRCRPITLQNSYELSWTQYSHPETSPDGAEGTFQYVIASID